MINKAFVLILFVLLCSSVYSQEGTVSADVKFSSAINNIRSFYVDSINEHKLVETALKAMLKELDPHSVYLTKKEIDRANEALTGNFDGVGITFQVYHDSVLIVNVLSDGPAARAGLRAGDRILRINSDTVSGGSLNNTWLVERLRGERGTTVVVEVYRKSTGSKQVVEVRRDRIPLLSIETNFMLNNNTGYIKLIRFSGKTMAEFYSAFVDLKFSGMQHMILDLRGNSGGYLQTAIDLADEFIGKGKMIVYTEGVNHPRFSYKATSKGEFESGRLIVLIDEGSASASEILAGAVQDCDRGLIIGRRSYGKGLVQRPYYLPDGSAIRLTTARYYTPSGRSIQKPYKENAENYFKELSLRARKGELYSADSIKFPDSLKFSTLNNRTVYGGGGIMPDYFIPADTTGNIPWYRSINQASIIYSFAIQQIDDNRETYLREYPSFDTFQKKFKSDKVLTDSFLVYCTKNHNSADTIDISSVLPRIQVLIKAHMASVLFDNSRFQQVSYPIDETLMQAIGIMNDKAIFRKNDIEY